MLAYYVEWHMRQRLAPILFDDHQRTEAEQTRESISGTSTKNRVRLQGSDGAEFHILAQPTPLQQRALALLEVSL